MARCEAEGLQDRRGHRGRQLPFWGPELGDGIDATDLESGERLRVGADTLVRIAAVKLDLPP